MADVVLEMAVLLVVLVVIVAIPGTLVAAQKSPAALRKQQPPRLTPRRARARPTGIRRLAINRTPNRRRSGRLHGLSASGPERQGRRR